MEKMNGATMANTTFIVLHLVCGHILIEPAKTFDQAEPICCFCEESRKVSYTEHVKGADLPALLTKLQKEGVKHG